MLTTNYIITMYGNIAVYINIALSVLNRLYTKML